MNYQFKQNLQNLLKQDQRFYLEKKDHFFKNKITECASNLDDKLIELLLNDKDCREKFFKTHRVGEKEITIFDRNSFSFWINHYQFLPDSYTQFKQNIGLSLDGNKLLRQSRDVSLIFPYKDCILEGGQTKEETKRDEIFFNEILAGDEIDRLTDKKVFGNFKRINQEGELKNTPSSPFGDATPLQEGELKNTPSSPFGDATPLQEGELKNTPSSPFGDATPLQEGELKNTPSSPFGDATPLQEGNEHPEGPAPSTPLQEGNNSPSLKGWQSDRTDGVVKWYELPYNPKLKERAKELRKAGNLSEVLFWNRVKNKQFLSLDFDRQRIIGNYIVDFYCKNLGVVVEIDGNSHNEKQEYDKQRDNYLKSLGLKVVHVFDKDVRKNLSGVLEWLEGELKNTPSSPFGDATPLQEGNEHPEGPAPSTPLQEGNEHPERLAMSVPLQEGNFLRRGRDGTIKENLIIKGNNLLVLHSLKNIYWGKVKLIYIDPPYNTGNDGFKYNDSFNHSSWLVFMKNRLEVAKELLRDDGVIFVQCDDNEQAYLKVLMDEVFGRDCFISNSIVIINRGGRDYGGIARTHEYLSVYGKNQLKELNFIEEKNKIFSYEDEIGGFNLMELRNRNILFNDKNRPNLCYPFFVNSKKKDHNGLLEISLEDKKGFIEVMPLKSQGIQTVWRWGKEKVLANLNIEIKAKEKKDGSYMIIQKYRKSTKRQRSVWDEKEFVNERGTGHIKKLFSGKVFSYPKSEFLLSRIIELSTNKNDIVLDYHLGSGTTAAVAHKMGRKYIGIEQMDYIETIAVERIKKVIGKKIKKEGSLLETLEYDQGGISKTVNWQGGGDFIYFELIECNEKFAKQIRQAKDSQTLINIYNDMKDNGFLTYRFEDEVFRKRQKDFEHLLLAEQKQLLMELLDKNMLYLNYDDIEDTKYKLDKETVRLNREFYGG